jgi:hypothetical protein
MQHPLASLRASQALDVQDFGDIRCAANIPS